MSFAFIEEKRFPRRLVVLMLSGIFWSASLALGQETASQQMKCAEVGEPSAWWTFDQRSGPQVATGSREVRSLLRGEPGLVAGRVGKGLELAQPEDGISIGPTIHGPAGDLTVETWLRTEGLDGILDVLRWQDSEGGTSLLIGLDGGRPVVTIEDGSLHAGDANLADGRWHHLGVVVTSDGALDVQVLVDGDPVTMRVAEALGETRGEDSGLLIGGIGDGAFIGTLDEFTIHDRSLRRTEIVAIWAAGKAGKCGKV